MSTKKSHVSTKKDAARSILIISRNMSQSHGLHVPSQLPFAWQLLRILLIGLFVFVCLFALFGGGESGLTDALKLYYMSHVRLSSVPSICREKRREQNRGWSQGNQGWGGGERNGEIS